MRRKLTCHLLIISLSVLPALGASGARPPEMGPAQKPVSMDMEAEYLRQHVELAKQLENRAWFEAIISKGEAVHRAALILDSDRDPAEVVLRRTGVLLEYVQSRPGAPDLSGTARALVALRKRLGEVAVRDQEARRTLYLQACRVRRELALANPDVQAIRQLLFIKRDRARFEHMCDQFYGFYATPGGGLFVLEDPFSPQPVVRDLLADRRVEDGRLKGRTLAGGAFLSPEVSFDGQTILFAYTEAAAQGPEWSPRRSYHLFRVGADGAGLVQLTDGDWNDFDPCWLPDGRVVFVSERRGGYLRCGARPCPTYTLFRMNADGTGIMCLSFHETHEWHPSIDHDGMIVYTRWDYVDRDTNISHHPWRTTPGGSDARAVHGNYPEARERRPWMEMDIRAVPGSGRYLATAAPHHGQAYGSLVLIDPRMVDDGAMAPVRRFTPEVPFPEAESGKDGIRSCEVYATAWPLNETVALCAYDAGARQYGIYLVDGFGNKELLYRDEVMACLSPMPLQPRPVPPIIPDSRKEMSAEAVVTVLNVYESQRAWPVGTRIGALRLIQLLPKTTPANNQPRIGVAEQTNARAVLGTVPVEADGSAHFRVPAGKPLYFQALDEQGLAIQSMRSVTYFQPGEQLTCIGCHESRHQSPPRPGAALLALQRPPSVIQPEVKGANPFNFVRLVQPVLDRHCVPCHRERQVLDLSGGIEGPYGWTRSYQHLAKDYGFYFHVFNGAFQTGVHGGSRTMPGRFGARAAALLPYLDERHHGLQMPREDWHRVTLWLDCNSEFYGAYEETAAQARGEWVWPSLE